MKITKVAKGIAYGDVSNIAIRNILTEISKQLFDKIDEAYFEEMRKFFNNKCPYTGKDLNALEQNNQIATDHIVPQNKEYCGLNIPGNLILCDKIANQKKGCKTIEQFLLGDDFYLNDSYNVRKARYDKIKQFQSKYNYNPIKIKQTIDFILSNIYSEVRKSQCDYIANVKNELINNGIVNATNIVKFIPDASRKIGDIVRNEFYDLLSNGLINQLEVLKLQEKKYSKDNFNVNFPILSKKRLDIKGLRYYSKPIIILGEEYYVTNDWHNKDKDMLVEYINKYNLKSRFAHR